MANKKKVKSKIGYLLNQDIQNTRDKALEKAIKNKKARKQFEEWETKQKKKRKKNSKIQK